MARVLLLGADRVRAGEVRSILRQDGHTVTHVKEVERWREFEREERPEVIVAAEPSGERVLGARGASPRGFPPPLLFVHYEADLFRDVTLDERLVDRIESPFMSEELLGRVDALVRARRVVLRAAPERAVESGPEQRTALGGWFERVSAALGTRVPRYEKPLAPYLEVAARIAEWADRRDVFEPGHAERVTTFSAMIAEALALPEEESTRLLRAAMLHDIGKVALPVEILRQKDPLRDEQVRLIRTHPERGATLMRALDRDESVAEAILYHHEQPDGEGYYHRKPGEFPRTAAILGVAESYDAMTSTKLHDPLCRDAALDAVRTRRGQKYDADSVDALVDALRPSRRSIPIAPPRQHSAG